MNLFKLFHWKRLIFIYIVQHENLNLIRVYIIIELEV